MATLCVVLVGLVCVITAGGSGLGWFVFGNCGGLCRSGAEKMKASLLLLALALPGCDKALPVQPERLMVSACQQDIEYQAARKVVFLECRP